MEGSTKDTRSEDFNRAIDATSTFLKEMFPHTCKFIESLKKRFSKEKKDNS